MEQGVFISIEGTDGSGKTTQIGLMSEYLSKKGHEVVLIREPGGTTISEKIRSIILDRDNTQMDTTTEMLLYASARAQLVSEVIRPAIESGKTVICDRFIDSSYVYQGYGRGIDLGIVAAVNRVALQGVMPDITFFFDISPEIALKRRIAASETDRIENEKMEFHMRVYDGYKALAVLYPQRIKRIDANRSIDEIFGEVKEYLNGLLEY